MIPGTEPRGEDGDPELRGGGEKSRAPQNLFLGCYLSPRRGLEIYFLWDLKCGVACWGCVWGDPSASILETLKGVGIESRWRAGL